MRIIQLVNFHIIGCNRDIQAAPLALGTKIQQALHLAIDIVIHTCHTQQAANIAPQHLHLALHEFFLQIKVDIGSV